MQRQMAGSNVLNSGRGALSDSTQLIFDPCSMSSSALNEFVNFNKLIHLQSPAHSWRSGNVDGCQAFSCLLWWNEHQLIFCLMRSLCSRLDWAIPSIISLDLNMHVNGASNEKVHTWNEIVQRDDFIHIRMREDRLSNPHFEQLTTWSWSLARSPRRFDAKVKRQLFTYTGFRGLRPKTMHPIDDSVFTVSILCSTWKWCLLIVMQTGAVHRGANLWLELGWSS